MSSLFYTRTWAQGAGLLLCLRLQSVCSARLRSGLFAGAQIPRRPCLHKTHLKCEKLGLYVHSCTHRSQTI